MNGFFASLISDGQRRNPAGRLDRRRIAVCSRASNCFGWFGFSKRPSRLPRGGAWRRFGLFRHDVRSRFADTPIALGARLRFSPRPNL